MISEKQELEERTFWERTFCAMVGLALQRSARSEWEHMFDVIGQASDRALDEWRKRFSSEEE